MGRSISGSSISWSVGKSGNMKDSFHWDSDLQKSRRVRRYHPEKARCLELWVLGLSQWQLRILFWGSFSTSVSEQIILGKARFSITSGTYARAIAFQKWLPFPKHYKDAMQSSKNQSGHYRSGSGFETPLEVAVRLCLMSCKEKGTGLAKVSAHVQKLRRSITCVKISCCSTGRDWDPLHRNCKLWRQREQGRRSRANLVSLSLLASDLRGSWRDCLSSTFSISLFLTSTMTKVCRIYPPDWVCLLPDLLPHGRCPMGDTRLQKSLDGTILTRTHIQRDML